MQIISSLSSILSSHFNKKVSVISYKQISGGSINKALKVLSNEGEFFVKYNSNTKFPAMFEKESLGLKLLRNTQKVSVPDLITIGQIDDDSFLILELIESANKSADFWDDFAKSIAELHKTTNKSFGLSHNNYIGSLEQGNEWKDSWCDFFRDNRLEIQLKMARDSQLVDINIVKYFERFYRRLEEIFPNESPALIHGDLWSGNFMIGNRGKAYLIDPAVYYGHREMDLGMSQLFGGFSPEFYDSYNKYFPLETGWQQRIDYCNLYPLLVHLNLFGGSYLSSVKSIISRF